MTTRRPLGPEGAATVVPLVPAVLVLPLVIAAIQVGGTAMASRRQSDRYALDLLGVALLLAGPAALVVRRRFPATVLAVTLASTLAYSVVGYARGPIFLALIVAFITVVKSGRRWIALAALAVGYVSFLWLGDLLGREPPPTLGQAVGLAAWLVALTATSEVIRGRKERSAEMARAREEEERRQASEERLRIAQELHDVLAHNISLINVQAGVALHLIEERPEQAETALVAIKEASKEALGELRSVLDMLRRDGDDTAPRAPAPALTADLDGLVARASAAGVEVRVEEVGERRALPPKVDRSAFRIAQEALTNVVRHAGGAPATLRVSYDDPDALVLQVDDDGPGINANANTDADGDVASSQLVARGNGITGMRERAVALGGRLEAGPRPGGGFRIRAWLPLVDPA